MSESIQNSNRKRKVRALLAGGLVLGIGAAVTLAAWSDNVFGNAEFASGDEPWNLQGNFATGAAVWDEYDVSPGGGLQFAIPLKDNMTPGDVVRAPVGLRLEPGQALGASITLTGPTIPAPVPPATTTFATALRYTVYSGVTATDCVAGNLGSTTVVAPNSPLGTGTTAPIVLPSGAPAIAGTPVELCFVVTLPAGTTNAVSGQSTGQLVWDFAGTSTA
ncbi:SipW-dependent-type signal peptide-containing protein [Rhodococcus ruber]|uniref:SipW-dependent-type signal peptide-containing protein n=1 Tax=Rhodococcus ruber TaxID=1830 RepID=A0ABT4ML20_9NOCA|nr:SipW-dependent-type signal peptide-containing protein [Rhodococcus ruber]MCZ4521679.1 SipW-dependent-type signal peptide-containing protein [Rhodococcus ruber]